MFGKNKKGIAKKIGANSTAYTRHPTDVLNSIPYRQVCEGGIIEDYDHRYSLSFGLSDYNFETSEESTQEQDILRFEKFIGTISDDMIGQINIFNTSMDKDIVRNEVLMKPGDDGFNDLRSEWNNVLTESMGGGNNDIHKVKTYTVSVAANNIKQADEILKRTEHNIITKLTAVTKQPVKRMTLNERMEILYNIFHGNESLSYTKRIQPILENDEIKRSILANFGISSKDIFAPDDITYPKRSPDFTFSVGVQKKHCRTFYLDNLPTILTTSILNDISNIDCNMITSVTIEPFPNANVSGLIKNQRNNINKQISNLESQAAGEGVTNSGVVSTELQEAQTQADNLVKAMIKYNMRMYKVSVVMILIADSVETLNNKSALLNQTVQTHLCSLRRLTGQQEFAFNTALPFARKEILLDRMHTTESVCAFYPFNVQDLNQKNGVWYGVNPLSNNIIRYNRKYGDNYNGLVCGGAGSGKSFIVKEEIQQALLTTNDSVIIVDPNNEYWKLCNRYNGTLVSLSLDSQTYINMFDMDLQFGGKGMSPIALKCSTIENIITIMLDGELSPIARTVLHQAIKNIYRPYLLHLQTLQQKDSSITNDPSAAPTLKDLYSELAHRDDQFTAIAQEIKTGIEPYCIGEYTLFAERTNINVNNRLIVYNVKGLTGKMKEIGMHICLNASWNRVIENGEKAIWTRLYIDEFHLFVNTPIAAKLVQEIYKTGRKWNCITTAITQEITDLDKNDEARSILTQSTFFIFMNQKEMERDIIHKMFGISPSLLEYITDQPRGHGIVCTGKTVVPFENEFPKETECYKLMDSKKGNDVA